MFSMYIINTSVATTSISGNVFNVCHQNHDNLSIDYFSPQYYKGGLDSDRSHNAAFNGFPASKPINPTIDFVSISF